MRGLSTHLPSAPASPVPPPRPAPRPASEAGLSQAPEEEAARTLPFALMFRGLYFSFG